MLSFLKKDINGHLTALCLLNLVLPLGKTRHDCKWTGLQWILKKKLLKAMNGTARALKKK